MSAGDLLIEAFSKTISEEGIKAEVSKLVAEKIYEEELLSGEQVKKRFKRLRDCDLKKITPFKSDLNRAKSYQVKDVLKYINDNKIYIDA